MTIARYTASGPTLEEFFASDAFVRFLIGPFGSGKTSGCCAEAFRRVQAQAPGSDGVRRSRGVVIRQTFRQLSSTTIPSWRGWFGDAFGEFSWSEPPCHKLRFNLPDGSRVEADVLFLALDGPDAEAKLRGLEASWAWVNEAREIAKPVLNFLLGRVGRYPAKRDGGATWSGIFGDTNSFDRDHHLYRLLEEERPEGWRAFKQPGGVLWDGRRWVLNSDAENLGNLPAGYYERQLAGQADEWIRVYLANEFALVVEGRAVFSEYRDSVHCAAEPLAPMPGLPLVVGVDFGLTPAAVFAQRTPRGQWHIVGELVSDDMGIGRFGELVAAELDGTYGDTGAVEVWGDPAGNARSQTDERTALDVLSAQIGFSARPAPTNNVTARLEAVRGTLNRLVDGKPGFVLSPTCRRLRKAMAGGYAYRRVQVAGERYADKPAKDEHSHVADALQYALAGGGEFRNALGRGAPHRLMPHEDDGSIAVGPYRNRYPFGSARDEPEVITSWNELQW